MLRSAGIAAVLVVVAVYLVAVGWFLRVCAEMRRAVHRPRSIEIVADRPVLESPVSAAVGRCDRGSPPFVPPAFEAPIPAAQAPADRIDPLLEVAFYLRDILPRGGKHRSLADQRIVFPAPHARARPPARVP